MHVRHAIAAVTVAAFALTLSACTNDPGTSPGATNSPAASPSAPPAKIRPVAPGYDLPGTAGSLRAGFPSFKDLTDDEIAIILNAGCDGIDATGTPQGGADAIVAKKIEPGDAAFSVLAAITLYCPEYSAFLSGNGS